MSFELGEPKPDEIFYDRKTHVSSERPEEDYQSDMAVHKDLFETISEAHYLPELGGPHDEALLESLVEKGCEDNQILGQALDKFAHLVHGAGDYAEDEDDILLSGAPVADIIDRLEQSLESPTRSSMTAAQGLLHLHHIGDHLGPTEQQQAADQDYMANEVFAPSSQAVCTMQTVNSQDTHNVNHIDYDSSAEKRLDNCNEAEDVMYTEPVPDSHETYGDKTFETQQFHDQTSFEKNQRFEEHQPHLLPDQSEEATSSDTAVVGSESNEEISEIKCENENLMDTIKHEEAVVPVETIDFKELEDEAVELVATDLSIKHVDTTAIPTVVASVAETTNGSEDNLSEKSDEQPRDLSVPRRLPTPHASPRRTDVPRAPSRESDAMQSPQPSGIPAVPSSPEIFTMPPTKSKQTLFLETLLSSPSPKMYTSEVTITKQQPEPLNLGKHRKSASPTITSYSDEIKKLNKEFGEPQEKRKRDSTEDLVKISKVFNKCSDDHVTESKKKSERPTLKSCGEGSPLRQLQMLKTSLDFNIPDPLLVPRDKMNDIVAAPGKEIPALLAQRPELRLPEAFAFPTVLQDPNILVISLSQLENILMNDEKTTESHKPASTKTSSHAGHSTSHSDQTSQSQPKPIPSMDALAGDIDAATSAALNQMLWLPYLSQLEAMAACSQNMDFLKALNSSGYTGANYPDLSQMFNPSSRLMGPTGFPMMPSMDYENRLQFAMWQEAMNHANSSTSQSQRPKPSPHESQMKELSSKSSDVQNPFVHSTKSHQSKSHSSARTSPIAHNYNNNHSHNQRMNQNPYLQSMYPGMNPNIRPNMPLPGLQIPYFNSNMMSSQRSPRTNQQKSPTSPYYQNNNYLQSVKQSDGQRHRTSSASSQESPRPRISVKSLQNLLEPTAAAASGMRRPPSSSASSAGRRREEPEVGSTTPLGEPPPPHLPPHLPQHAHPHDPSSFHLWHPLFGNQKGYASPWSWTTVTATGD